GSLERTTTSGGRSGSSTSAHKRTASTGSATLSRGAHKRSRYEEEEEEDEEDEDSFLDDDDEDHHQASRRELQELCRAFAKGRNYWEDEDDFDDAAMEVSWRDALAEENRSARLGALEDRKDMEEELRRKKEKQEKKKKLAQERKKARR
ncbi:SPT2 chromatin protein, partial [Acanthamoeba castellanii str. Neff]